METTQGRAYVRPLTSLYRLNQENIPAQVNDSWADSNTTRIDGEYTSLAIEGITRGYICGFAHVLRNGKFTPNQQFQIEPDPWGWMGDYSDKDFNLQGILKHIKTHLFYTMDSIKGSSWLVLGNFEEDLHDRTQPKHYGQFLDHLEGMGSCATTRATFEEFSQGKWGYDGTFEYLQKYYGVLILFNGDTEVPPKLIEELKYAFRHGIRFMVLATADHNRPMFNNIFSELGITTYSDPTTAVLATKASLISEKSLHGDHISWTGINTTLNTHRSVARSNVYRITPLTEDKPEQVNNQPGNWQHIFDGSYTFLEDTLKANTPHFFREKCCVDPGDIFESEFTLESFPYKPDEWKSGLEKGTHIIEWQNADWEESEEERKHLALRSASSAKGFVFTPQARVIYSVPTDVSTASMFNDPATAGRWGPNTWSYNGSDDSVRGRVNTAWSGAFNKNHLEFTDYTFEAELGVMNRESDNDSIGLMFRIQLDSGGLLKRAYYMVMDRNKDHGMGIKGLKLFKTKDGIKQWGGSIHFDMNKQGQVAYSAPLLKTLRSSGWSDNKWYKYRIECVGTRIRIWEDGVLLCDIEDDDPDMSKGAFGPTNYSQAGCSFKNFKYFESEAEIVEGPKLPAHIADTNIDEESKVEVTTLTARQLMAGVIQKAYEAYKFNTGKTSAQLSVNYYTAKSETDQVIVRCIPEGTEVYFAWGSSTAIFESEAWAKYGEDHYPGAEGYNIITLDRSTKEVIDFRTYNPGYYVDASAEGVEEARAMAEYLKSLTPNEVVGIFTSSKVRNNRLRGGLEETVYDFGGSEDKYGSDNMSDRSEYVPIYDETDAVKMEDDILRYQGNIDRTLRLNFKVAVGSDGASWSGSGKNATLVSGVASSGGYFTKSGETLAGDIFGTLTYSVWAEVFGGRVAGSMSFILNHENPNLHVALVQDPNVSNNWVCQIDITNKTEATQYLDLTVKSKITYNSTKYQTGFKRSADPANYILIGSPELGHENAFTELLKNGVDSEGNTHLVARFKWGRKDALYPTNGEMEVVEFRENNRVADMRYTKKMERHWGDTLAGFYGEVYIEDVRFKKLPMHHRDDFYAHVQHPCVTFENSPDFTVNDIDFAECSKTSFSETVYYEKTRGLLDDQMGRMYMGVFVEELQRVIFDGNAIKFTNLEMDGADTTEIKYKYFIQCLNWLKNANRPKKILLMGDTEDGDLEYSVKEAGTPTVPPKQEIDPETGEPKIDPDTMEPMLDENGDPMTDPVSGEIIMDPDSGTPYPAPELTEEQKQANKGFGLSLPQALRAEGWDVSVMTFREVEALPKIPEFLNGLGLLMYVGTKQGVVDTEAVNLATFIETANKNGLGLYLTTLGSLFCETINTVAVRFTASFTDDIVQLTTDLTASKAKYEDHLTYGDLAGSFEISDGKILGSKIEPEVFSKVTKMEDFCRPVLKGNLGITSVATYELLQARAVFDAGVVRYYNSRFNRDTGDQGQNITANSNVKMFLKQILEWIITKPNNKKLLFTSDESGKYNIKGTGSLHMGVAFVTWLRSLGYEVILKYWWEISNPTKEYFDQYGAVIFAGMRMGNTADISAEFCTALEESVREGTGFYALSDSHDGGSYSYAANTNKLCEPFLVRWKNFVRRSYHDFDKSIAEFGEHPISKGLSGRMISDDTEGEIEILGVSSKKVAFTVSASEPIRGEPISIKVKTRNGTAQALSETNSVKFMLMDHYSHPLGGYLDDDKVRVVFDGGFPKYYNQSFPYDNRITTTDPLCNSNIKQFVKNCLNWLNPKHRAKRVLFVGDRSDGNYNVKSTGGSSFNGPYVQHMRNLGWQVDIRYWWDLGNAPSPLLFDQYAVVIFMSSNYIRNDSPTLPYTWAKALESSVKRGTGLKIITDHSGGEAPSAGSFQSNANMIAKYFYAGFYGLVNRYYANVDASRNSYGSHPLIAEMYGRMTAQYGSYGTEGIVRSDGTFGELQDYIPVDETITFFPGEQHKEVEVTILCDNEPEADEDFYLVLSEPDRGEILKKEGRAVILDDDGIPFGTQTVEGQGGVKWHDLNYKNSTGVFVIDFETWMFDYAAEPNRPGADDRLDVYRDRIWVASTPFGSQAVYDREVPRAQNLPLASKNTKVFIPHYAELGHSAQYESRVQAKHDTSPWRFITMEEPVEAVPATIDYITDKFAHRYVIHDVKGRSRLGQQTVKVTVRNTGRVDIQQVRVIHASIIGPGTMEVTIDVDVFKYIEIYGEEPGLDYDIEVL